MEPILEIAGLRVAFGGVPVLHGIDLSLRRGESWAWSAKAAAANP